MSNQELPRAITVMELALRDMAWQLYVRLAGSDNCGDFREAARDAFRGADAFNNEWKTRLAKLTAGDEK